jgi:hypothetical protein
VEENAHSRQGVNAMTSIGTLFIFGFGKSREAWGLPGGAPR